MPERTTYDVIYREAEEEGFKRGCREGYEQGVRKGFRKGYVQGHADGVAFEESLLYQHRAEVQHRDL